MMVSCGSGTQLDDIGYKCFSGGYKKIYQSNNTFDSFQVKQTEYTTNLRKIQKSLLATSSFYRSMQYDRSYMLMLALLILIVSYV